MSLAPPLTSRGGAGPTRTRRASRLGYAGLAWALSYVPIHVYWALGGLTSSIGITGSTPNFRVANWGACVVIVGAGLTCLALVQRWGDVLPRALRHGAAWVGGVLGIAHWLIFSVMSALRLLGVFGHATGDAAMLAQMHHYDWANLLYFEPWFGVMGALLIACSRYAARRDRASGAGKPPASAWRHVGTALTLAGIAVVVWGVFTFDPWVFAGYGPALMAAGVLTLVASAAASRKRSRS